MTLFSEYLRTSIRAEFDRLGLTHREVADRVGISRPQVTRMLGGSTELMPLNWARLLAALQLELRLVATQPEGRQP